MEQLQQCLSGFKKNYLTISYEFILPLVTNTLQPEISVCNFFISIYCIEKDSRIFKTSNSLQLLKVRFYFSNYIIKLLTLLK